MFVGSVYWLLNAACSLDGCRVTIFDCTSEDVVWDSNNYDGFNIAEEVDDQRLGDYDVCSYDLWVDGDNKIHLEINIKMDEDE